MSTLNTPVKASFGHKASENDVKNVELVPSMDVELSSPASTEHLHKLLDEYKEYRVTDETDKPGESIGLWEARENLMDYLDVNYNNETDWKELYPVIKNDNILVNRYWAFIEDFIK